MATKNARKIKTKPDPNTLSNPELQMIMGGWYDGRWSYLWFGDHTDRCIGTLSGQRLYRLAKTIVKEFEKVDQT
jgi:hypothetical protein